MRQLLAKRGIALSKTNQKFRPNKFRNLKQWKIKQKVVPFMSYIDFGLTASRVL